LRVATALSSGFQKLGQPVPLSNLVVEANKGKEQPAQENTRAMLLVERAAAGRLRGLLAQHGILLGTEPCTPLGVGVADFEGLGRRSGAALERCGAERSGGGCGAQQHVASGGHGIGFQGSMA
jgi:hypothetical protein